MECLINPSSLWKELTLEALTDIIKTARLVGVNLQAAIIQGAIP